MTVDLLKRNSDFAIYTPALQSPYVQVASGQRIAPQRNIDSNFFNFFLKKDSAFYWPYALYSAGQQPFTTMNIEQMVFNRSKHVKIITDSGGYQIINGKVLDFGKPKQVEQKALQILDWQMKAGNIGVIIDVPLGSIDSPKQPFINSFDDCLNQTIKHINIFANNGMEKHSFLNAIHGRNPTECNKWYAAVRQWRLQGWAFGGFMKENLYLLIRQLLILIQNGDLAQGKQDWIHLFGIGIASDAIYFTAIKRGLRRFNPNVEISFDTASWAIVAGRTYSIYEYFEPFGNDKLRQVSAPKKSRDDVARPEHVTRLLEQLKREPQKAFWDDGAEFFEGMRSPVLHGFNRDDLVVDWTKSKAGWDNVSVAIAAAHNLYVTIDAIQGTNWCWDRYARYRNETEIVKRVVDAIDGVFTAEDPMAALDQNKWTLGAKRDWYDADGYYKLDAEYRDMDELNRKLYKDYK